MPDQATPDSQIPPLVGVLMGSKNDWEIMRPASDVLTQFDIPHECQVISAHRTPRQMCEYAESAATRGLRVIIAGAGMAAGLPGMAAAMTVLPVLGVPIPSQPLQGIDALLSMLQMPGGVPVGTLAIGSAGARNAGLLAIRILAGSRPELHDKLLDFHKRQTEQACRTTLE